MYKMDKTVGRAMTHKEAEKEKLFPPESTAKERLDQAWYLTYQAYDIDPENHPKIDKTVGSSRKHTH